MRLSECVYKGFQGAGSKPVAGVMPAVSWRKEPARGGKKPGKAKYHGSAAQFGRPEFLENWVFCIRCLLTREPLGW